MKKTLLVIFILFNLCFTEVIYLTKSKETKATLKTELQNTVSATLDLNIPAIRKSYDKVDGEVYNYIRVENLTAMHETGKPSLPVYNFDFAIPEGAQFKYSILEQEFVVLDNINAHPALQPYEDSKESDYETFVQTRKYNENSKFEKNSSIYSKNDYYPNELALLNGIDIYRGTSIAAIRICPVQFNPITKKLKVYTRLKLKIEFKGGVYKSGLKNKSETLIKRSAINGYEYTQATQKKLDDAADDIIVITTPKYIAPVNELVKWQRQKGYEVKVESKSSWSVSSVMSTVKDFYDNTAGEYMLIVGDFEDVPADSFDYRTWTDLNYVLLEGLSDKLPDLANGRIPAATEEQAWTVINKILKYEKDPIMDEGFYKNQMVCSQFQDLNKDDTADHRFTLTAYEMKTYVEGLTGYNYECVHLCDVYDNEENPMYWDNDRWSFGGIIPEYLQRPNCSWDDGPEDITREIEKGKFLVMHRDHGDIDRWAWPRYRNEDIIKLQNGDKTPVVFSLNCLTGRFKTDTCLAEAFLRMPGGAVGVVAACRESYSGWNDAFCHGLYDAIWPGTKISSPKVLDPDVPEHEPIYTMGDVVINGTIHQNAGWSYIQDGVRLFHYFGDPTMEIRTAKPKTLNATFSPEIHYQANEFNISGLNITNGYATLYSKNSDKVVGKCKITGSSAVINLSSSLAGGDSLIVTVRSHNYIPVIKTIPVVDQVDINPIKLNQNKAYSLFVNGQKFSVSNNKNVGLFIYSVNGRQVLKRNWNKINKNIKITVPEISSGVYFVKINIDNQNIISHKLLIHR